MVKKKAKKDSGNFVDKIDSGAKNVNYWMIATVVLAALLLINGVVALNSGISKKTAEKRFVDFASAQGAAGIQVLSVKSVGNLHEITFSYEGQVGTYHISKDGKYIGAMEPISGLRTETVTQTQQQASAYSQEDLVKLQEFNQCLANAGVKLYGANWCGWTQQWVQTLGGQQTVTPIYVECTTNEALCASENVMGYPTTKINGQEFSGARTIEGIAAATGCLAPQLTGYVAQATTQASC